MAENRALVVIDLQNDITKNYRSIIGAVNTALEWADRQGIPVVYIRHEELSEGARAFRPGTRGTEAVPEMRPVPGHVFVKHRTNALTSEAFTEFIAQNGLEGFIVCGADATACVKSTCYNMRRAGYAVTVLSDCVTSYAPEKLPEMLKYYEGRGCTLMTAGELTGVTGGKESENE